jgi:hypothetical protein
LQVGPGMRIILLAVALVGLLSFPRPASTCSPAFDYGNGPDELQPYDPDLAPAPPVVRGAVARRFGSSAGCGGGVGEDCRFTGLFIEFDELPETELILIVYPDGDTAYARPRETEGGAEVMMYWQSWHETPSDISIAAVTPEGHTSAEVEVTVVED